MDPQMTRAHGHHYDQDPLHPSSAVGLEGDGEHHEKKSVLKKVKAKAKKIKDTLTSKTHGHGHDHDHDQEHDGEEEYEEDDEIVQDPGIHGAPMYESAAARNFATGQELNPGQPRGNLGDEQNVCPGTFQTKVNDPNLTPPSLAAPRSFGYDASSGTPETFGAGPPSPKRFGAGYDTPFGTGPDGKSPALENFGAGHDLGSTGPGSYGVGHDTGRKNYGAGHDEKSPALGNFGAGHDLSSTGPGSYGLGHDTGRKNYGTGHDEKSGALGRLAGEHDATPAALSAALGNFDRGHDSNKIGTVNDVNIPAVHDVDIPAPGPFGKEHDFNSAGTGGIGKFNDTFGEQYTGGDMYMGEDTKMPGSGHQGVPSPNYQSKLTDSGTVGGQDVGATPFLHSFDKMKIYDEPQHKDERAGSHDQFAPSESPAKIDTIPETIPENAPAVPESFNPRSTTENYPQDMNVDKPSGGYTGKISAVTSAITGTALSAKNAVASKMGYGGSGDNAPAGSQTDRDNVSGGLQTPSAEKFSEYESGENTAKPQSTYTEKLSAVPSAIAGTAVSAKNAVASKIGYGGATDNTSAGSQTGTRENISSSGMPIGSTERFNANQPTEDPSERQSSYTEKLTAVPSAIAGTAVSAKNAVASKLGYGGTADNASAGSQTDRGEHIASTERFNANQPAEDSSKHQSTYTEKISAVPSAIAGTAVSAKNVVASKLGYGGSASPTSAENANAAVDRANTPTTGEDTAKAGGGVTGYGKQIASTVTGKLAPVYGTVAGAGSAVLSKIPGTGMGTGTEHTTTGAQTETARGVGETDKGIGSMKGYISEKFKPGDEDKALSDVISGALHKRKAGEDEKSEVRAVVSDAVHKRSSDDEDRRSENKPMGKVTESKEVANRLGSSDAERAGKVPVDESGTGVVDKFKGAFTNWFGKGGEMNPSQAIFDHSGDKNEDQDQNISREGAENPGFEGERRLHEPTSS